MDPFDDMDIVEVAKLLRKELKLEFPNAKFKVRVDRYSMGEAIDVFWVNGPASIKVDKLLKKYEDIDYDQYTGEILAGGNRYVLGHRQVTEDIRAAVERKHAQVIGNNQPWLSCWHEISSTDYYEV